MSDCQGHADRAMDEGVELAKIAPRDGQHFDCATWLHKGRSSEKTYQTAFSPALPRILPADLKQTDPIALRIHDVEAMACVNPKARWVDKLLAFDCR